MGRLRSVNEWLAFGLAGRDVATLKGVQSLCRTHVIASLGHVVSEISMPNATQAAVLDQPSDLAPAQGPRRLHQGAQPQASSVGVTTESPFGFVKVR